MIRSAVTAWLLSAAGVLAQTAIEPRIVSETLPSGGLMQIKLQLTSPHPIIVGGPGFDMDTAFESIEGVSLFSPAGDAYGVAVLQGRRFRANIVSPQGSLGTQLDYPFLVVASTIRSGLPTGTQIPIALDGTSFFQGPGGVPYSMPAAKGGVLTIGGSVSVTNIIPGGGVLPAGATVRVLGTGFTPETRIDVSEVAVSSVNYVGPTEIGLTLAQAANLTGTRVRVRNPDKHEVVYYSYFRAVPTGSSTRALLNASHPIFLDRSAVSAGLSIPSPPSSGFIAVALQNSGTAPADVQLQLMTPTGTAMGNASVSMPAGTRISRTIQELFNIIPGENWSVRVTSTRAVQVLGLRGDEASGTVTAFAPGAVPDVRAPVISSIVDAASQLSPPAIAPGEIVTIYGSSLGPSTPLQSRLTSAGLVDTINGTTRVWIGGVPAPILYTSTGQVNAIVPYEVSNVGTAGVEVEYQGTRSAARSIPVARAAPGVFTMDSSGRGQAAVLNQDYGINSARNPAARGSVIMIYATGNGQTTPFSFTGEVAGAGLKASLEKVTVTIGGERVDAIYAGSAPGMVAGLLQVNVAIPAGTVPGAAVPVAIEVGGVASQGGATIAVQ